MFVAGKALVVTSKKVKSFSDILYLCSEPRLEKGAQEIEVCVDEMLDNIHIFNIGFKLSVVFDKVETMVKEGTHYRIEGYIEKCQRIKECRHFPGALSQARYLTGKKFFIDYRVGFMNKLEVYSDESNLQLDEVKSIKIHNPIVYDHKAGVSFLTDKISTNISSEGYEPCEEYFVDFLFECEYQFTADIDSLVEHLKKNKGWPEKLIARGRILYCLGEVKHKAEDKHISVEDLPESPSKERLFTCSDWFRWRIFTIEYENSEFFIKFR